MADYTISRVMQQSLLTLLCMSDEHALIIRNSLPASSFEGEYGDIARAAYAYVDEFKKAPKTHLDDVLDQHLQDDDRKAERISEAIKMIRRSWRGGPNIEYIMGRLEKRHRWWVMKTATQELFEVFNAGLEDDEAINRIEAIINKASRTKLASFNPGTRLGDVRAAMTTLFRDRSEEVFPTGVPDLDKFKLGPRRKGLHIFIGLAKTGKTRWLVQVGKHALMQDFKVLHVSLEMPEEDVHELYLQSWLAFTEQRKIIYKAKFYDDEYGDLARIGRVKSRVRTALDDRGAKRKIRTKLEMARTSRRLNNLVIKAFPTSQLTYGQLVAYMDRLEAQEGFVPDLVIVDYPKLMDFENKDPRIGLGQLLEKLRGLAVERNMAMSTVAQVRRIKRREGEDEGSVTSMEIGEDFSQIQTLDVGLVFRQSSWERKLGIARILVDNVRRGKSGWEILITQNYDLGQFCIQSKRMRNAYWDMIKKKVKRLEKREIEEDEED